MLLLSGRITVDLVEWAHWSAALPLVLISTAAASATVLLHGMGVLLLARRVVQHTVQVLRCRTRPRALVRRGTLDHRTLLIRQLASATGLAPVARTAAPALSKKLIVSGIRILCVGL